MLSRRDALKGLALIAAAVALPSCSRVSRRVSERLGHVLGAPTYTIGSSVTLPPDFIAIPQALGTTYYVDPRRHSQGNDGLSKSSPLRTVMEALEKDDVGTVVCRGGIVYQYDRRGAEGLGTYRGRRNVSIVSDGEEAIFATSRKVNWEEIEPNLYRSTKPGGKIQGVVDSTSLSGDEDAALIRVSSLEECRETPRSWTVVGGRAVVSMMDRPDSSLLVLRSIPQGISAPGVTFHCKGIHFIGGADATFSDKGSYGATLFFENCRFSHSPRYDGLRVKDSRLSVALDSDAFNNGKDGFNYHAGSSTSPHFLELRCNAYGNKKPGTGNGSTAHDACVGMRFDCKYTNNDGPGIADIDATKSWNANCLSKDNGNNKNSYGLYVGGSSECWVDGLSASNKAGAGVYVTGGATLHVLALDGLISASDSAIVDSSMG